MKLPSHHPFFELRGSAHSCGRAYGESQVETIAGFLRAQLPDRQQWQPYAGKCWAMASEWQRPLAEFIRGMAEGTGRPVEEIMLLLMHEEIGHAKACTAFGATGSATTDGQAIIGQNWDWDSSLYNWSHLLRITSYDMPAVLTYAYPGLWASAGINEYGLSLVWTSSGIWPQVRPIAGISTYVLIAGILTCRTADEALALIRRTCNAGSFNFFIADAGGAVWLVEGIPGKTFAVPCTDVISRANHFHLPKVCTRAKQRVPRGSVKCNSRCRANNMAALLEKHAGNIDAELAEALLSDHSGGAGKTICQHDSRNSGMITLDSIYLLPARRELCIARGVPCRHVFQHYTVG